MGDVLIVSTAHVSAGSIEDVRRTVLEERPALVAVELDEKRYRALLEGKDWKKEPIASLLRTDRLYIMLANALLLAFQRMVGHRVGSRPGEEMLAAVRAAEEVGAEVAFVDRDITRTMRRALDEMSLREKLGLARELLSPDDKALDGEVATLLERYKESDMVASLVAQLKELSPAAWRVLLAERDAHMARRIAEAGRGRSVVAVVGAAHAPGIAAHLRAPEAIPAEADGRGRVRWGSAVLYALPLVFVAAFLMAAMRGASVWAELGRWALIHGVLSGGLALLAGGSAAAALVAFVVSPLTSIDPFTAAGWFAGLAEAWWRGLCVADLEAMGKVDDMGDLLHNKAFRVLLVAAAANVGSTLATLVCVPTVLGPLLQKLGWAW